MAFGDHSDEMILKHLGNIYFSLSLKSVLEARKKIWVVVIWVNEKYYHNSLMLLQFYIL